MSGLKPPLQAMPDWVRSALNERGLMRAYDARPAYQRNDYLWWINSAKRDETKRRRLDRMLAELEAGGGYMSMAWRPR